MSEAAPLSFAQAVSARCQRVISHRRFEPFLIVCILVNCVQLALNDPTWTSEPLWYRVMDAILCVIFVVEAVLKLCAAGRKLYFSNSWNWLDATVATESVVGYLLDAAGSGGGASPLRSLKALRVLRPLRALTRFPQLQRVIIALGSSLRGLADILLLLSFYLLLFSLVAVSLWSGALRSRCVSLDGFDDADGETNICRLEEADDDGDSRSASCLPELGRENANECNADALCEERGNPSLGYIGYDNIPLAFLTLFQMITFDRWYTIMLLTQRAVGGSALIFFMVLVVTGACVLTNLVIASILAAFTDALAEIEEAKAKANEDAEHQEEDKAGEAEIGNSASTWDSPFPPPLPPHSDEGLTTSSAGPSGWPENCSWCVPSCGPGIATGCVDGAGCGDAECPPVEMESEIFDHQGGTSSGDGDSESKACVGEEAAATEEAGALANESGASLSDRLRRCALRAFDLCCYHGLRDAPRARDFVTSDTSIFGKVINGCIFANTITLALDDAFVTDSKAEALAAVNMVLTLTFTAEAVVKLIVLGVPDYLGEPSNVFDAVIVTTSTYELVLSFSSDEESGGSSVGALRVFRLIRLMRLARGSAKLKCVKEVFENIVASLNAVWPMLIVLGLFLFIVALLGCQMFGQMKPQGRTRFDSFFWSWTMVFNVLIGEDWSAIAHTVMDTVSPAAIIFFLGIIVIGQFCLLNMVLAVLLDSSSGVMSYKMDSVRVIGLFKRRVRAMWRQAAFHQWVKIVESGVDMSPADVSKPKSKRGQFAERMMSTMSLSTRSLDLSKSAKKNDTAESADEKDEEKRKEDDCKNEEASDATLVERPTSSKQKKKKKKKKRKKVTHAAPPGRLGVHFVNAKDGSVRDRSPRHRAVFARARARPSTCFPEDRPCALASRAGARPRSQRRLAARRPRAPGRRRARARRRRLLEHGHGGARRARHVAQGRARARLQAAARGSRRERRRARRGRRHG